MNLFPPTEKRGLILCTGTLVANWFDKLYPMEKLIKRLKTKVESTALKKNIFRKYRILEKDVSPQYTVVFKNL